MIRIAAAVHGLTVLVCRHAADRPDGTEADGLRLIRSWL
jgi:hypothetical protein